MTESSESATQLERAIDTLLRDGHRAFIPGGGELVDRARVLRRALPRLHPRFGFEELLAARLASARRAQDQPATQPGPDSLPEPRPLPLAQMAAAERRRNLVAGGPIAPGVSLALPLAGADIVVWRRSRSSGGIC